MNPSCLKSSKHPYSKNIPPVINHLPPDVALICFLVHVRRQTPSPVILPTLSCHTHPVLSGRERAGRPAPILFILRSPYLPKVERRFTMPEEKRSTYSGQTEARRRASAKYLKEAVEDVRIRVPKGQKAVIKAHAESQGESMNDFVVRAIDEAIEQDAGKSSAEE